MASGGELLSMEHHSSRDGRERGTRSLAGSGQGSPGRACEEFVAPALSIETTCGTVMLPFKDSPERLAREEAPEHDRPLDVLTLRLPCVAGEAFFMSETLHLGPDEIGRMIRRLAHEIIENNRGAEGLVLAGMLARGFPIARRLAAEIAKFERIETPVGSLDIGLYRDDVSRRTAPISLRPSAMPDIDGATVVLVDDVLFTGRSVRAALDALLDFGRPARVRLAVLVDRGHRELPIRPDFVGKNIPTALVQSVDVCLLETDGEEGVYVSGEEAARA